MTRRLSRSTSSAPSLSRATEEAVVLALLDLTNHITRRKEQLAALAGLTTHQWLVLLHVANDPNFYGGARREDSLVASEIARARGVTRATVSVLVSELRRLGLVAEEVDPEDRRRRRLVLTRQGTDALETVQPARLAANRRLLAPLDPGERRRFLGHLTQCLDALGELGDDAPPAPAPAAKRRASR